MITGVRAGVRGSRPSNRGPDASSSLLTREWSMGTAPRVLVTGAGIAGPAAAYWLDKAGFDVTVIERAPTLRPGGQNIDVRGTGREVLSLMGLENAVRERNTGEIGTRFYDQNGTVVSEFGVDEQEGQDGPTAELEILRGALSQILVDACPESVRWRFGQSVGAVADTGSGVDITLSDGRVDSYELLVIAEGVGSHTRDLSLPTRVSSGPSGCTPRTARSSGHHRTISGGTS